LSFPRRAAILRATLLKKIKTAELEAADLEKKLHEADAEDEEEIERLTKERENALDEAERVREEIDGAKQKATEQYNVRQLATSVAVCGRGDHPTGILTRVRARLP